MKLHRNPNQRIEVETINQKDWPPMNSPLTILGIAGSLRQGSYNRMALRAAQQLVPEGTKVETFDLQGIQSSIRTKKSLRPPSSPNSRSASAPLTPF
jgi:NADPH-dependent FMN reductase